MPGFVLTEIFALPSPFITISRCTLPFISLYSESSRPLSPNHPSPSDYKNDYIHKTEVSSCVSFYALPHFFPLCYSRVSVLYISLTFLSPIHPFLSHIISLMPTYACLHIYCIFPHVFSISSIFLVLSIMVLGLSFLFLKLPTP